MKVEISHISKTLRGAKVLDDVSLTLEGGNIYGLMGENGLRYKLKKLSSTSLR